MNNFSSFCESQLLFNTIKNKLNLTDKSFRSADNIEAFIIECFKIYSNMDRICNKQITTKTNLLISLKDVMIDLNNTIPYKKEIKAIKEFTKIIQDDYIIRTKEG